MDYRVLAYTMTSACGYGLDAQRQAFREGASPLRANDYADSELNTWIGRVPDLEQHYAAIDDDRWRSRNNALANIALQQDDFFRHIEAVSEALGAHRVGVIIGTSTSSIGRTESGYRQLDESDRLPFDYRQPQVHNPAAPGLFVAHRTALTGPVMTISTACSSSGKVFAAAARWMQVGLVDAVLVGGVDSLCLSILHGFASLELTSPEPCKPFDAYRDGISIGEAAGFALMVKPDYQPTCSLQLRGYGETSDAHHMAQPHPQGLGARIAMQSAITTGGLQPSDIGYVNLHGTASRANDYAETLALRDTFSHELPASSTKGWTGHTLGAAGMTGAIIAMNTLCDGMIPGTKNLQSADPELAFPVIADNQPRQVEHVMTNSFGFGGNNCSLVFSIQ